MPCIVAASRRFTPIKMPFPIGTHPVAGNREFGLRPAGSGYVFYTQAADRAYDLTPPERIVLDGAQSLWRSMQTKVAAFVNAHGGQATITGPVVLEPSFEQLKAAKLFTRG